MQAKYQVRRAVLSDADWIVDLSTKVQAALTASGSLQQIGPSPLDQVEMSIQEGYAYLLEVEERRVGSTLIDPLKAHSSTLNAFLAIQQKLFMLPTPHLYLHSLMLDPSEQGNGLGLAFLEGVKKFALPTSGTILLNCWAGNTKLRDFYQRAGFTYHGNVPEENYEVAVFSFAKGNPDN